MEKDGVVFQGIEVKTGMGTKAPETVAMPLGAGEMQRIRDGLLQAEPGRIRNETACERNGHRFSRCGGDYIKSGNEGPNQASFPKMTHCMLFCGACGETKEIVCEDRR